MSTTVKNPIKTDREKDKATTSMRRVSLRRAQIAASLTGDNVCDFLSKASDNEARKIIEKAGVKLPADAAFSVA